MNISKTTVRLTVLLNLAALCCLICFAAIYLRHDTTVPNPDAMLPAARWEGAGFALTAGLLPMSAANTLAALFLTKRRSISRLLCFLPAAAELLLVIHFWYTSLR